MNERGLHAYVPSNILVARKPAQFMSYDPQEQCHHQEAEPKDHLP